MRRRTTPTAPASIVSGPSPRYVSNRIFNDVGQNVFSENRISQWGWLWAQFLDHTFGLRDERPAERSRFRSMPPMRSITLADNKATLLMPRDYLPRSSTRGDSSTRPTMDLMGPLVANPTSAVVAGDVRANENLALTAVHTLFAREQNRIVSPRTSSRPWATATTA